MNAKPMMLNERGYLLHSEMNSWLMMNAFHRADLDLMGGYGCGAGAW
jgi:hypothetical protein